MTLRASILWCLVVVSLVVGAQVCHATQELDSGLLQRREAQRAQAHLLAWSRDPFLHSGTESSTSELHLSGILWDPHQPLAIINGTTVSRGDNVAGCRVVEIQQDQVDLTDGTQTYHLRVNP